MKILAIRGANLASLHGKFELSLSTGPLADAGLFVITGPTGAGKSTLLDALCLALFDDTPRLRHASTLSKVKDAEEGQQIGAGDPRQLLSRGAAHGFAEVDFQGRDGQDYRARWELRRARNQSQGRLQPQSISLVRLSDEQALGGTKSETKQAIQEALGLSAEQFMRAVLLPQGDFAAFLRADEGKRAELLERLTGTQLYGQISALAHEKARQAKAALGQEQGVLDALAVWPPEVRQAVELEAQEAQKALGEIEKQLKDLQEAQSWLAQRQELHQALALVKAHHDEAQAQCQGPEGQALQQELKQSTAAWSLADALALADELAQALSLAESQAAQDEATLSLAQAAQKVAQTTLESSQSALERESQARLALAPRLDALLAQRSQLAQAQERKHERQAAEAIALAAHQQAAEALSAWKATQDQAQSQQAAATSWLQAKPQASSLAKRWDELAAAMDAMLQRQAELSQALEGLAIAQAAKTEAQQRHLQAQSALNSAQQATTQAQNACLAIAQNSPPKPSPHAHEEATLRQHWRQALESGLRHNQEHGDASQQALSAHEALAQSGESLAQAEALHRSTQEQLHQSQGRLEEAQNAWRLAEEALGLASRRQELLRPNEACPLCGACEHPWAHEPAPTIAPILQARCQEASQALETAQHEAAQALRNWGQCQAQHMGAQDRAAACHQTAQSAEANFEAWSKAPPARPWPESPSSQGEPTGGGPPWSPFWPLTPGPEAQARLELGLEHLQQLDQAHAALALAWEHAQQEMLAAKEQLDSAQRVQGSAEVHQAEAEKAEMLANAACRQAELVAQHAQNTIDQAWRPFDAALGGANWRAEHADGLSHLQQLAESVQEAQKQLVALSQAEESLAVLLAQGPLLKRDEDHKAQALAQEQRASAAAKKEWETLTEAWALAIQAGEPEALRDAQEENFAQAQVALTAAQSTHGQAEIALAGAHSQSQNSQQALVLTKNKALTQEQKLAQALRNVQLSEAEARRLLGLGKECLAKLQTQWDAACDAEKQANTLWLDRKAALDAWNAKTPHPLANEALPEALAQGENKLAAAQEGLRLVQWRLAQDDGARIQRTEHGSKLLALESEWQGWAELDELIGSGDGKKFRTFAQGISLGLLVQAANRHLAELHPRYRLEKAEQQALALQVVDLDMADERRGTLSLSGGESFLISLALALALGEIQGGSQRLGSLFIDEGFGSLDAQSLELALHALDALQAGGRQVGLISHVSGLGDRLGVQVRLQPIGGGRSRLLLPTKGHGP